MNGALVNPKISSGSSIGCADAYPAIQESQVCGNIVMEIRSIPYLLAPSRTSLQILRENWSLAHITTRSYVPLPPFPTQRAPPFIPPVSHKSTSGEDSASPRMHHLPLRAECVALLFLIPMPSHVRLRVSHQAVVRSLLPHHAISYQCSLTRSRHHGMCISPPN